VPLGAAVGRALEPRGRLSCRARTRRRRCVTRAVFLSTMRASAPY